MKNAPLRALIALTVLAIALGASVLVWQWGTRPLFLPLEYSVNGTEWKPFTQPLWLWNDAPHADVRATFAEPPFAPSLYSIRASGRIDTLTVNGTSVLPETKDQRVFPIGRYMMGRNVVITKISNTSHGFSFLSWSMTGATGDPLYLGLLGILSALSALLTYVCIRLMGAPRSVSAALTFGVALRLIYVLSTPEWVRAFDWEGHHQYVLAVLSSWTIPPAALGWETYQPPLFYFLAALVKAVLGAFGFIEYEALQIVPLVLSVGTLLLAWRCSRILWPESSAKQCLFLLLISAFPGLVFQASQISNDALFTLLGVLWLLCMLRFQASRSTKDWVLASLVVTFGLLTKSNTIALIVAQAASLILLRVPVRRAASLLGTLILFLAVGSGWYLYLRFVTEGQSSIVGNVGGLPDVLRVPNLPSTLLTFDPFQMIRVPFVNDIEDWSRRQFFWEYVFKSSLFGSQVFPSLLGFSRIFMISALAVFGIAGDGWIQTHRTERTQLLTLISLSLLGALLCYRVLYPMSSNQHFRFIAPIVLPLAAFVVSWHPPQRWLATLGESVIVAFTLLSAFFVWSIASGSL